MEHWQPIVDASLAFSTQLSETTDIGLKNPETAKRALENFQGMIEATAEANEAKYNTFASLVD